MRTRQDNIDTQLSICQEVITRLSTFGDRLKEERARLRLTQEDFGALGGVRKQAQHNYEKGERFPDADYLARITNAGVDAMFLLTGMRASLTEKTLAPEEAALIQNYRKAIAADQAVLQRLGVLASEHADRS